LTTQLIGISRLLERVAEMQHRSLEEMVEYLFEGEDKRLFSTFLRKMLHWEPEKRQITYELLQDEWPNIE
jgi:hypothetical protein